MRLSFFIMPIYFLKAIRDEYTNICGEESSAKILFNCGLRCGQIMTKKMEISGHESIDLAETLHALWIEVGLGRLSVENLGKNTIKIMSEDSTEAQANGSVGKKMCDMTCGFIAGIASEVTGQTFECFEEECWSAGDDKCVYMLRPKV
jgi:predicted hydrocarbon binding protein